MEKQKSDADERYISKHRSEADKQAQNVREMLQSRGVVCEGERCRPWLEASIARLGQMLSSGVAGRTEYEKALLGVLQAKAADENVDRIVKATNELALATDHLVNASNSGTRTMARLQKVLIVLTVVIALAAVAGVWVNGTSIANKEITESQVGRSPF